MVTNVNLRMPNGIGGDTSPLVEQLARKADGNHDGTVTSAEFTAFLSSLMESLDAESRDRATTVPNAQAEAPAAPPALSGVLQASPASALEALRRAVAHSREE